jgi:hypothetical protein
VGRQKSRRGIKMAAQDRYGINMGSIYADLEVNSGKLEIGIAKARSVIGLIRDEIKKLRRDASQNLIDPQSAQKQIGELTAELAKIEPALRTAQAAFSQTSNAIQRLGADGRIMLNQFGIARNRMTELFVGFSYSLNDFFGTSGTWSQKMIAVANNMPMIFNGLSKVEKLRDYGTILMGFGLGLSAILPIVAAIINNWDVLTSKFQEWTGISLSGLKQVETQLSKYKRALEDLQKTEGTDPYAPVLIQKQKDAIDKIEGGQREQEKFRKEQTTTEEEKGKAIGDVLKEIESKDDLMSKMAGFAIGKAKPSQERVQAEKNLDEARSNLENADKIKVGKMRAYDPEKAIWNKLMDVFGYGPKSQYEKAILDLKRAQMADSSREAGSPARQYIGDLMKRAKEGTGKDQIDAMKELSEALGKSGAFHAQDQINKIIDDFVSPKDAKKDKDKDKKDQKEKEHEIEKTRKEAARALQDEYNIVAAETNQGFSNREIEDLLIKYGIYSDRRTANADSNAIGDILSSNFRKEISEYASKNKIPVGEAQSRFAKDIRQKEADKQEAREKKEESERKAERRKSIAAGNEKIQENIPGFNKLVDKFVAKGMLMGMDQEQIASALSDEIQVGTKGEVNFVDAGIIAKEKVEAVQQKLSNLAYGMRDEEVKPWRSEVYGASELSKRIQQGVGAGQKSEESKELRMIRNLLEQQSRQGILRLQIK